jgi:uncharacterized membrane protein YccC
MRIEGIIGVLVVAFVVFAVGTLFDPAEYMNVLAACFAAGALAAVLFRQYFKRRSKKDEIHIIKEEREKNTLDSSKRGVQQKRSSEKMHG